MNLTRQGILKRDKLITLKITFIKAIYGSLGGMMMKVQGNDKVSHSDYI